MTPNEYAPPLLAGDQWLSVLRRLSAALVDGRYSLGVVGGVAMALSYSPRRTTRDLDAILDEATALRIVTAAETIAPEFGLPPTWLNNKAQKAGFVVEAVTGNVVFDDGKLEVRAGATEQLLGMKLAAWRDELDFDDAVLLLKRMAIEDMEMVWAFVGRFVPVDKRARARHNLEEAWELWRSADEPA